MVAVDRFSSWADPYACRSLHAIEGSYWSRNRYHHTVVNMRVYSFKPLPWQTTLLGRALEDKVRPD